MFLSVFLLVSAFLVSQGLAKTAAEWAQMSIYQVVVDRFALTDGSTPACGLRDYCGGTWKGLEKKLDYIQGMGFDAVWISPVVHNIESVTDSGYAYHGYWTDDPYSLNAHYGTASDLTSLSNAIHSRNMSLMLDVVINHMASPDNGYSVDYSVYPAPFNTSSAFHKPCLIDYTNQTSVENCWLMIDPTPSLPDLNTENPNVLNAMIQSVVNIVQTYNIDGIRLDTTKHVPKTALAQFQDAVEVFVTGEAYDGNVKFVAGYQGPLDGAANYPMFFGGLLQSFVNGTSLDILSNTIHDIQYSFSNADYLTNFLDNPDQPRFASYTDDIVRLQSAVTFIFLHSGIPVMYYGTEQQFNGNGDPYNREGLWISGYNENSIMYKFVSQLNQIRHLAADIYGSEKYFSNQTYIAGVSDNYIALERGPLMAVISNLGSNEQDSGYQVPGSQFGSGIQLVDLTNCQTTTTGNGGSFTSAPNGGLPRIWIQAGTQNEICI